MDIIVLMRTCRRKEEKREETDAMWCCLSVSVHVCVRVWVV